MIILSNIERPSLTDSADDCASGARGDRAEMRWEVVSLCGVFGADGVECGARRAGSGLRRGRGVS